MYSPIGNMERKPFTIRRWRSLCKVDTANAFKSTFQIKSCTFPCGTTGCVCHLQDSRQLGSFFIIIIFCQSANLALSSPLAAHTQSHHNTITSLLESQQRLLSWVLCLLRPSHFSERDTKPCEKATHHNPWSEFTGCCWWAYKNLLLCLFAWRSGRTFRCWIDKDEVSRPGIKSVFWRGTATVWLFKFPK